MTQKLTLKNTTLTAIQLYDSANGAAAAQEYNVALAAQRSNDGDGLCLSQALVGWRVVVRE